MGFNISDFYQMGLSAGNRLGGVTKNLNTSDKMIPELLNQQNQRTISANEIAARSKLQAQSDQAAMEREKIQQKGASSRTAVEAKTKMSEGKKDRASQEKIANQTTSRNLATSVIGNSKKGVNDPLTMAKQIAQAGMPGGLFGTSIGRPQPNASQIGQGLQQVLGSISDATGVVGGDGMGGGQDFGKIILQNPTLTSAYLKLNQVKQMKGIVSLDDLAQTLGPDVGPVMAELKKLGIQNIEDVLNYINS